MSLDENDSISILEILLKNSALRERAKQIIDSYDKAYCSNTINKKSSQTTNIPFSIQNADNKSTKMKSTITQLRNDVSSSAAINNTEHDERKSTLQKIEDKQHSPTSMSCCCFLSSSPSSSSSSAASASLLFS